jgi:hypothetical protein
MTQIGRQGAAKRWGSRQPPAAEDTGEDIHSDLTAREIPHSDGR